MSWQCQECGLNNDDSMARCICGSELEGKQDTSKFHVGLTEIDGPSATVGEQHKLTTEKKALPLQVEEMSLAEAERTLEVSGGRVNRLNILKEKHQWKLYLLPTRIVFINSNNGESLDIPRNQGYDLLNIHDSHILFLYYGDTTYRFNTNEDLFDVLQRYLILGRDNKNPDKKAEYIIAVFILGLMLGLAAMGLWLLQEPKPQIGDVTMVAQKHAMFFQFVLRIFNLEVNPALIGKINESIGILLLFGGAFGFIYFLVEFIKDRKRKKG